MIIVIIDCKFSPFFSYSNAFLEKYSKDKLQLYLKDRFGTQEQPPESLGKLTGTDPLSR